MSQDWTDDSYASGHVGDTDLTNIEKNFLALKSLFSGAAQPASMAACHPWFDTTKHVLKVRNDGDAAWIGLMHGDVSQKIWIYRNAALSGWAIDSGVSDKVLGLKGGSTYTTGAAVAGTWTQPNHTHPGPSHTHSTPAHWHPFTKESGVNITANPVGTAGSGTGIVFVGDNPVGSGYKIHDYTTSSGAGTSGAGGTGATGGGATVNTYRPAAAVGTLQYLDL